MNAPTLAAKAGAAPSTYIEPKVTGSEQLVRDFIRASRQGSQEHIDRIIDCAEVSGVADIIRNSEKIVSKDYVPEPSSIEREFHHWEQKWTERVAGIIAGPKFTKPEF